MTDMRRLVSALYLCMAFSAPCAVEARSVDERVYLVPAGAVDARIVEKIKEALPGSFPMAVKAAVEPEREMPRHSYDPSRKQYDARIALDELSPRVRISPEMERALFITDADLFVPEKDFVFGLSDKDKGASIMSLKRLRNEFYGAKADERAFIGRAVNEALRRLGYSWGLSGCPDRRCAMYTPEKMTDDAVSRARFCLDCQIRLRRRYSGSLLGPVSGAK